MDNVLGPAMAPMTLGDNSVNQSNMAAYVNCLLFKVKVYFDLVI